MYVVNLIFYYKSENFRTKKESEGSAEEVEIDARRSCNDLILSVVRRNQSPQKELELDEDSEVCRSGKDVVLGDFKLKLKFKTEDEAKEFRRYTDFRFAYTKA